MPLDGLWLLTKKFPSLSIPSPPFHFLQHPVYVLMKAILNFVPRTMYMRKLAAEFMHMKRLLRVMRVLMTLLVSQ